MECKEETICENEKQKEQVVTTVICSAKDRIYRTPVYMEKSHIWGMDRILE